tara:strand:+ start:19064 stop:19345 length:282 start_codon:yes stop_codon:yes gene_type:complete
MAELKMEHVLILLIAVFLLYHLMNRCRCNGFSVGSMGIADEPADNLVDTITKDMESVAYIENLIEKKVIEEIKNIFPSSESPSTDHSRHIELL